MSLVFLAAAAVIVILALIVIALPILKMRPAKPHDRIADAMRERLTAIARDLDSGLIEPDAAAEAEIEAKRAAAAEGALPAVRDVTARSWRFAAIAFLGAAPIAVAFIYLAVGAPALIDPPPAGAAEDIAALPEEERRAMIESMVSGLAARLEEKPGDAEGWRMLARSQMVLGRPTDAAASYRRLLAIGSGDVDDWRDYATTLAAMAPDQQFPADEEFLRAIGEIEKRAPGDMMALFYRGGAARQSGDAARAAAIWRELLQAMPADAPVRETLEDLIAEADGATPDSSVPK